MSVQITTAMRKQFKDDYYMLAQQKQSKLERAVRVEDIKAEDGYFDTIGAADGNDITDRHGDTQYSQTPHDRRKCTPIPWEWADLIDTPDKLRVISDPQNKYVQTAVAAANRRKDDHIITAFFGSAWTGKTGATEVTYPTAATHVVPVDLGGSAEGLTLKKVLRAVRLMQDLDIETEDEELYIAVAPIQIEEMLQVEQATSADYQTIKALQKAEIDTAFGLTWIRHNRLLTDSNSYRRVPVWAKSGMVLGLTEEKKTFIDRLPTKRHTVQVRVEEDMGAMRMEEAKVIEIKCSES